MRQIILSLILAASSVVMLTACSKASLPPQQQLDAETAPYVVAINNPLQYFAQRIGAGQLDVRLAAPAEGDPARWQPGVDKLLEMQAADLIFLNGAGYSGWVDKVSLADHRLVVTSESARDLWIERLGEVTHSHGPQGAHAHSGYFFTTWMDMELAGVQAEAIAAALIERQPENLEQYARNLEQLLADIEGLNEGYKVQLLRLAGRQFIYSHPVYQYFERGYEVPGTSLHWESDVMPSEAQWSELAEIAGKRALFVWEAKPAEAIARRMGDMGIPFVVIDPAANAGERDWLAVQRANIERLRALP